MTNSVSKAEKRRAISSTFSLHSAHVDSPVLGWHGAMVERLLKKSNKSTNSIVNALSQVHFSGGLYKHSFGMLHKCYFNEVAYLHQCSPQLWVRRGITENGCLCFSENDNREAELLSTVHR